MIIIIINSGIPLIRNSGTFFTIIRVAFAPTYKVAGWNRQHEDTGVEDLV